MMARHAATDRLARWNPPTNDLGRAARTGVRQTASFRIISLVVQFGSAAVLARLLGPALFGVIAVATLVTAFATIFNDMGIGSAIVQRSELDEQALSAAFWINFAIGFVLAGIICATTPLWVAFFDTPQLSSVLPLSSLTLVLSVSLVQRSLLQRSMRFREVMGLDLLYGLASAAVSIALALAGVGVLSIPIGAVVATLASSIVAFMFCPWLPRERPTMAAVRSLWSFSGSVLWFNILNYWSKNLDNVLVGRFLGAVPLGLYSRAYNLMQLPVVNLSRVLTTVLFPALSSIQKDVGRFARAWTASCAVAVTASLWIAATTAVAAPSLVLVLYGSEWSPMSTTLSILMCATPAYVLSSNASPIFLALGATRLQFRLGLVAVAVRIVCIVAGLQFGYQGVAVGILVSGYLVALITLAPAARLAQISLVQLLTALRWPVLATCVASAAGLGLRFAFDGPALLTLCVIGAAMTAIYFGVMWAFDQNNVRELIGKPAPKARREVGSS